MKWLNQAVFPRTGSAVGYGPRDLSGHPLSLYADCLKKGLSIDKIW